MCQCFLVGSEKDGSQRNRLKVLHYIEYLTFDLENRRVQIVVRFRASAWLARIFVAAI